MSSENEIRLARAIQGTTEMHTGSAIAIAALVRTLEQAGAISTAQFIVNLDAEVATRVPFRPDEGRAVSSVPDQIVALLREQAPPR